MKLCVGTQEWECCIEVGRKIILTVIFYKQYREILSETKEKAFAVGKRENKSCGA